MESTSESLESENESQETNSRPLCENSIETQIGLRRPYLKFPGRLVWARLRSTNGVGTRKERNTDLKQLPWWCHPSNLLATTKVASSTWTSSKCRNRKSCSTPTWASPTLKSPLRRPIRSITTNQIRIRKIRIKFLPVKKPTKSLLKTTSTANLEEIARTDQPLLERVKQSTRTSIRSRSREKIRNLFPRSNKLELISSLTSPLLKNSYHLGTSDRWKSRTKRTSRVLS